MKTAITEMFGIRHPIIQGGMHYVGLARTRLGGVECRRPRHHHRPDAEDAGIAGAGNRALPRRDRPAVRRQPHLPAGVHRAALSRIHPRHHRRRRQDRRDRGTQPRAIHAGAESRRHQGHPQMHVGAAFAQGRADRLRRGQRRRLRMRRPSRRGRRPQHDPAAARRRRIEDSIRGVGRHGRCAQPRCRAGARRRRHEHGHALYRHQGGAGPRQRQAGDPRRVRARHAADHARLAQHRARAEQQGGRGDRTRSSAKRARR